MALINFEEWQRREQNRRTLCHISFSFHLFCGNVATAACDKRNPFAKGQGRRTARVENAREWERKGYLLPQPFFPFSFFHVRVR